MPLPRVRLLAVRAPGAVWMSVSWAPWARDVAPETPTLTALLPMSALPVTLSRGWETLAGAMKFRVAPVALRLPSQVAFSPRTVRVFPANECVWPFVLNVLPPYRLRPLELPMLPEPVPSASVPLCTVVMPL